MPSKGKQTKPSKWARAEAERIITKKRNMLTVGATSIGDDISSALDRAAARENRACAKIVSRNVGLEAQRAIAERRLRLYGKRGGK